jgi:hypothetical protein
MKEREFKKLVFENFVQAKKELIREGYIKRSDNLNFEDVFSETKKRVLEERVKSLQRENEMLKKQLKGKGLQEAGTMSAAGMGKQGGSKLIDKPLRKLGKFFGNATDSLTDVAMQLNKNYKDYTVLLDYISDGTLNNDAKIAKAISFIDLLYKKGISGSGFESALDSGIEAIGSGGQPEGGIFENRKRRRY